MSNQMKTKKQVLVTQSVHVKGIKNGHAFFILLSLIGTTNLTPDLVYGNVKSANNDLFTTILVSPTIAP